MTAEAPAREPFLTLPGFAPDAVGFALRTSLALLLAYFIAFWSQLDSASSAGLCVAIVAQASPGMAMSKALYRIAGTVLGGVAAVAMVGAFGQDRTALLAAFTLWLGACTFVAALLRDFRSYGAVLCGYTVGIVAVAGIDAPQGAMLVALNRVAAILVGVASVAIVNSLLSRNAAYEGLLAALRRAVAEMATMARDALAGAPPPDAVAMASHGAALLALTTEASYAATELPDGSRRVAGAREAIAALLAALSAVRALGAPQPGMSQPGTPQPGTPQPGTPQPGTAGDAFMRERASELARQQALAEAGLHTLASGGQTTQAVRLRVHHDAVGALLSATRTMAATGLGAVFCVVSGWPGVTLLLVQQAAFTALLGMQADPSRAGASMGWSLPLPALMAGMAGFLLLPGVSGFGAFATVVGPCAFVLALLSRHPRLARFGPGLLLYFTLLLAPADIQGLDLAGYFNNVLVQVVAVLFMLLAFRLILPVSRKRRLARVAVAIMGDLRHTLRRGRALDPAACQSLSYDRLAQAQGWLGRPTPARLAVFTRLHAFAELDTALRRAWSGLEGARRAVPELAMPELLEPLNAARASLLHPTPVRLGNAAHALLAYADAHPEVLRAVSGLHGAQLLLARQARALRHYGVMGGNSHVA